MRTPLWKRSLAAALSFLVLLGPGAPGLSAKLAPPIIAPTLKVQIIATQKEPRMCPVSGSGTDMNTGRSATQSTADPLGPHSPAIDPAPTYNSGSQLLTAWGLGWSSPVDQTIAVSTSDAVTWSDGTGAQLVFFQTSSTTFASPVNIFETLTAVRDSSGAITSLVEADPDGTKRAFAPFESTATLRMSGLVDRNGNPLTYTRDSQGRLTKITDVHGRYFNIGYNAAGLVSSLADSGGRTSTFLYDAAGHRTSESTPIGATAYVYDANNRMTKITYPNGGVRNYTYDSQGRVLTQDDGSGNNALTYVYTSSKTTVTDALGRATVYEFVANSGLRRVSKMTDPSGGVTSYTYDANMNLISETDPNGHVTHYTYDAKGNVTATQDAAGGTTSTSYDPRFSLPLAVTDPNFHTTNFGYDDLGNNTDVTDPLSQTTHNSFDSMGHVVETDDPLTHATRFTYDGTGSLASTTDPNNRTTNLINDLLSRVTKNTDPAGHATNYEYDAASDMTQVTDALGGVTQYTYSPGRTGKLLTQVKDALNHTTTFGYDDLGRLTSVTNALNQTKTSQYDAKGNLIQTTNARGQVTTYEYNANDRLTKKHMVEGDITFAYDAAGNMLTAHHYNGSALANTYDADNRLTQQVQTLPSGYQATLGYTYDAAGNRKSMSTPWGTFNYTYDANNRLTSITNPQNLTFTFEYDAAGRRTKLTYPNGIVTAYAYDAAGQVLSITATRTADQVIVSSIAYTYDAAGNRTSMTDWSGTHTYGYDTLNRLTSATHPAASHLPVLNETFTLDAVGNRLADAQLSGYAYDVANRLLHNSEFSYGFNADGDMTVRTDTSTNQTSFGYDSANEQTSATTPSGENWSYDYDALGRRVSRSSTTASAQQFVYDASGEPLATLGAGNNSIFVYTSEPRLGAPLASLRGDGRTFFYHAEVLGSVVAHTDSSANLLDLVEYTAYGQATASTSQGARIDQPVSGDLLGYLGLPADSESRSQQLGLRYLDSQTGRFGSEDPIGFAGGDWNLYAYTRNSPISFRDATGLIRDTGWEPRHSQSVPTITLPAFLCRCPASEEGEIPWSGPGNAPFKLLHLGDRPQTAAAAGTVGGSLIAGGGLMGGAAIDAIGPAAGVAGSAFLAGNVLPIAGGMLAGGAVMMGSAASTALNLNNPLNIMRASNCR